MRNKQSRKVNIPFTIAVVLLCLLTFSVYLTSGMLARYTTRASFSDSARVAKFTVGATGSTGTMAFEYKNGAFVPKQGSTNQYTLTVSNASEVAVRYNVVVENLPAYVTATVSGTEYTVPDGGNSITIPTTGDLAAGSTSAEMTITFGITAAYLDNLTPTTNTLVATDTAIDFDALVRIVQID
jgi:uncharacterized repeat protein (TIGR01451 family)